MIQRVLQLENNASLVVLGKGTSGAVPGVEECPIFRKHIAGNDSGRHLVIWEYESLAAYEAFKARRKDYEGPYKEYKENDAYYKGVFIHSRMGMEFWKDKERNLWIE